MTAVKTASRLTTTLAFEELTAADLMTGNPLSLRDSANVDEAIKFMTDRAVSGAPVINASGRPIGVISRTDLMIHERERRRQFADIDSANMTPVSELMTPIVFTARLTDSAQQVMEQMVALNVHRLFVVDSADVLVGVITPLDVLRKLV